MLNTTKSRCFTYWHMRRRSLQSGQTGTCRYHWTRHHHLVTSSPASAVTTSSPHTGTSSTPPHQSIIKTTDKYIINTTTPVHHHLHTQVHHQHHHTSPSRHGHTWTRHNIVISLTHARSATDRLRVNVLSILLDYTIPCRLHVIRDRAT